MNAREDMSPLDLELYDRIHAFHAELWNTGGPKAAEAFLDLVKAFAAGRCTRDELADGLAEIRRSTADSGGLSGS